jgi:predicted AAA+ superfamily ATPase
MAFKTQQLRLQRPLLQEDTEHLLNHAVRWAKDRSGRAGLKRRFFNHMPDKKKETLCIR